jgi:hypothetical protein
MTNCSRICRQRSIPVARREFHTFVYAGPMFAGDLPVELGEIVSRDRFVFADLSLRQNKVNTD